MNHLAKAAAIVALPMIHAVSALNCDNGTSHKVCHQGETCCGTECCPVKGPFYTHWYFWLAVSMFLILLLVFVISACRHFRRERKYNCYCQRGRPKPELNMDSVYLHYHMPHSDTVLLPLYEELEASGAISRETSPVPPPPPYSENDSSGEGSCFSTSLPPSYSQVLLTDQT